MRKQKVAPHQFSWQFSVLTVAEEEEEEEVSSSTSSSSSSPPHQSPLISSPSSFLAIPAQFNRFHETFWSERVSSAAAAAALPPVFVFIIICHY